MKFKCLIVDDDERPSWLLKTILEEIEDIKIVGMASSGQEALKMAEVSQPDIVFMDIVMPGMNGMETSKRLTKGRLLPLVAITTGYVNEYVELCYKVNPAAFITKPFDSERISGEVERLKELVLLYKNILSRCACADIDSMPIKTRNCVERFLIPEILFFHSVDRELFMELDYSEPERVMHRMKELEVKFTGHSFIRVHKSYLVNMKHIRSIVSAREKAFHLHVGLEKKTVPISREYIKRVGGINILREMLGKCCEK